MPLRRPFPVPPPNPVAAATGPFWLLLLISLVFICYLIYLKEPTDNSCVPVDKSMSFLGGNKVYWLVRICDGSGFWTTYRYAKLRPWISWEVFGCFAPMILAKEGHILIWDKWKKVASPQVDLRCFGDRFCS